MKKLLVALMVVAMLFANGTAAYAVNPATVNVKVEIDHTISIEIAGGSDNQGTIDFGKVGLSSTAVADKEVTVKNNGTGVTETITLAMTVPSGWSIQFQFAASKPAEGDSNWKDADAVSKTIDYDVTEKLWAKLVTPATTSVTNLDTPLTISAE